MYVNAKSLRSRSFADKPPHVGQIRHTSQYVNFQENIHARVE